MDILQVKPSGGHIESLDLTLVQGRHNQVEEAYSEVPTHYENGIDDILANILSNFGFVLVPNMIHMYIFLL